MKCDRLLGEGYTCNNEHNDPSGLCSTHRDMPGPGSSVRGLRRERDRLYDQAASDTLAAGRMRASIALLEGQVEHKDEALRAAIKQMGEFQAKYLDAESAIGAARMFATSAKEDATDVCLALRSRKPVIPENAERVLYFVRQILSAVGTTPEARMETIRRLLDASLPNVELHTGMRTMDPVPFEDAAVGCKVCIRAHGARAEKKPA